MDLLKEFMANILKEFGPIDKESIIAAAVGLVALIIFLFVLEKRKKDERLDQPTESIHDQDKDDDEDADDDEDEQEEYSLVLKDCRERVQELLNKLDGLQGVYVEYFDEDQELSNEGYMYALIRFFLDGYESWIIFYPNPDYNLIMMVYNKRIPDDRVAEVTDIIDEFYDGYEGTLLSEEDEYPACLWDVDNNYSLSCLINDLINAVKKSFVWEKLLYQFRDDQ